MVYDRLPFLETLQSLPPEWPEDPLPAIQAMFTNAQKKLVILDDDPTGNQTVFNIPVLTDWPVEALRSELENELPAFFILTNSRSLPGAQAEQIALEIGQNLASASRQTGRSIAVVSRGDSTLRGHFPGEVNSLVEGLQANYDAWILIPALIGAGRYTINDIHYARDGEWLVPVGQTTYARDATFGYKSSRLPDWVEEQSKGRIPAASVASISIEDIRLGGPKRVFEILFNLPHGQVAIANAASRRDFEVLVAGIMQAEALGRQYLYRTTATFIPARFGLGTYPTMSSAEMNLPETGGGLLVIGSYVAITGQQMKVLFERESVAQIEVQVSNLLEATKRTAEIESAAGRADRALQNGRDAAIFTSRDLITTDDPEQSLAIGRHVSSGVIEILNRMEVRPRYLLTKGGITSHDVATKGMGVRRAMVIGQIYQGISVWQFGPETRYPGLNFVVFPGNVGGPETLADVVQKLSRAAVKN